MRLLGLIGAAGTLLFAACGGGGDDGGTNPNTNQTLSEIRVSPTTLNLNAGSSQSITVTAHDAQGGTINNPGTPTFQSVNPAVAEVTAQGAVLGISAGTTSVNVSLVRGGVTAQATVQVVVTGTLPTTAQVAAGTATNTFQPQAVAIKAGGSVTWSFGSVLHNVTFSAGSPTGGNIGTVSNTTLSRTFPNAGNFPYDCTLHAGMTGTVVVR